MVLCVVLAQVPPQKSHLRQEHGTPAPEKVLTCASNAGNLHHFNLPPKSRTGVPILCTVPVVAVRHRSALGARQEAMQGRLVGVDVRLFGEDG